MISVNAPCFNEYYPEVFINELQFDPTTWEANAPEVSTTKNLNIFEALIMISSFRIQYCLFFKRVAGGLTPYNFKNAN